MNLFVDNCNLEDCPLRHADVNGVEDFWKCKIVAGENIKCRKCQACIVIKLDKIEGESWFTGKRV